MGIELERDQLGARLAAQHAVARELLAADSFEEAAPSVLQAIARVLGWEVAAAWEVVSAGEPLHLVATCEVDEANVEPFWALTRAIPFEMGIGLPGRAWEEGGIVWSTALATDPNFPRVSAAAEVGLNAGFAVPFPVGDPTRVVGVLEFFTRDFREPDEQLKQLLVGFGDQLAQFVERRRAERAVRASEGLKSAILASALDCVITIDHRGCVTEFNPAAEETFGRRREEVIGQELASLVIPYELREKHRSALRHVVETGESSILDRRIELSALRADGSEFPIELTVTRLPGSDPPVFTGFVRDIGSRQQAHRLQRHLASIVESTEDAVESVDLEGVITSWNPGAERLYGYSADEMVGRNVSVLVPEGRRHEAAQMIATGRAGAALDFEAERVRKDGSRVDVSLTISPVTDAEENMVGLSIIARDVTARRRQEVAKDFLAKASAALDASLDPATTLRTIAETAVPDLGELCVIDLRRDDGSIGDAVAAATDASVAQRLERLRRDYPLDPDGDHPVAEVLRTGKPSVIDDLSEPAVTEQVAQSDEHREFMLDAGYHSAAVVPMLARGRKLGAISLLHVRSHSRYDPYDLSVLADLGTRAAMALDNARLYDERARVARTLQRSLLPPAMPEVPGAEIAASFRPAGEGNEVGGDFYDVWGAGSGWALVVGDVCGKGAEAAALTALIRYSVRALVAEHASPSRILELVNDAMGREELDGRFATVVLALARIEDGTARVRIVTAGHPPSLVIRAGGEIEIVDERGTLLGVGEQPELPEVELTLEVGDVLVLYTDGVLEAGAPRSVLTPEDLRRELGDCAGAPASQVVARLEQIAAAQGGDRLRDDIAVVALRVTPAG